MVHCLRLVLRRGPASFLSEVEEMAVAQVKWILARKARQKTHGKH